MTYDEARLFIEQAAVYGSRPGLETITELLTRLDKPQDKLKIIHIAGTNGKGSTGAFISSILAAAGYRVGRYISPAVFDWREKIQLAYSSRGHIGQVINDYITEAGVIAATVAIKAACEEMVRDGFSHPTVFEIETAMAFIYLLREKADFAVIETGMGGRLDATNVATQPLCSVITSISMDHMQYLGDTVEQITREKAGIIKKGVPVVTGNTDPVIVGVLKEACNKMDTTLTITADKDVNLHGISCEGTAFSYKGQEFYIKLLGEHQVANAILAVETIYILQGKGYNISRDAIDAGLRQTVWRGRFEIIAKNPYFIIDGAHNEDAAHKLCNAVRTYFSGRRLFFIMGMFADKEYTKVLKSMAPLADTIITITPPTGRALPSTKLAKEAKRYFTGTIIDAQTVAAAIAYTDEHVKPDDVILAFGSLSFLQELTEYLNRQRQGRIN